ncbi:uncharacterized protein LOC111024753 [Momordica charantia]|uniref:Uncharacterized protein LOC111024753 n=1 Tax=Momordica charantia TaxID=3673 RepID=A0A6J1E0B5_MOMCH|nr:uncharacterized protein LOC111024753 [Momordica charantia]
MRNCKIISQLFPQNPRTNRNATANDVVNLMAQQFRKLHPPSFDGRSTDSIVAEEWIEEIENNFDFIECNDRQEDRFKELFFEKFFPPTARQNKEAEFIKLEQGRLPPIEYEKKFEELSHCAPHLVNTNWRKARQFERGLRPELKKHVVAFRLMTYAEVLQATQILSQDLDNTKSLCKDGGSKRKFHGG